jgi:hypothetical protein
MKRHLLFLWFMCRPSLVWLLRAVFWVVTAPIGLLCAMPRVAAYEAEIWLPVCWMEWIEGERGESRFAARIAAARQAADEAVQGIPRTESETLLRVVGGEE